MFVELMAENDDEDEDDKESFNSFFHQIEMLKMSSISQ
jgi:hypothetical protein